MGDGLGDKLTVDDEGFELLGDGGLNGVFLALSGVQDVHFGGLGGHDFSCKTVLGEVHLNTGSLVDGDGRSTSSDLNLNAGSINDLNTRDGILNYDGSALAVIDGDAVHLALDLNDGVLQSVDVDGVAGLGLIDDDLLVVDVVLDDPFVSIEDSPGWLDNLGLSTSSGSSSLGLVGISGDNAGLVGPAIRVRSLFALNPFFVPVLGLHIVSDLLQSRGDISSLVQGAEHSGHISTLASSGGGIDGASGGRRGRAWGRGSSSGGSSGSSGLGGGSISTLGVP